MLLVNKRPPAPSFHYQPNATVSKIFAGVPGARYWQYGYWVAPCAAVPTIGFGFSAATPVFNVKPSDMNLGQTYRNSPDCVMSIVADSIIGQSLLMGDTFLKVSPASGRE